MEKRVKIYLGISAILILISLLPLIEAYQQYNNRQIAKKEHLLTELTIDKSNITEVNAADNINVDSITVEHIFKDDSDKEIVAHNIKQYNDLMKRSKYYIRTYQLGDQLIQINEDIKDKQVSKIKINKQNVNVNISTQNKLNNHYINSPIIYEKFIESGETLLMVMHQDKDVIQYIGMHSHTNNMIGKISLDMIDIDGVWNNRMNLVGFKTLPKQHLSFYIFNVFIFYPLITLILGLFLCYICILRIKMTSEERMRKL